MSAVRPLTLNAVEAVSTAIFEKGPPTVVEAYSAFGRPLQYFAAAADLVEYAEARSKEPHGAVHIGVHYADMAGRLKERRIALDPSKCDGHTYRYGCEGWGLIWVHIELSQSAKLQPSISANSEKRAMAWAKTYAEMDPPSTWNWSAVASHLRRLRRVLRKLA